MHPRIIALLTMVAILVLSVVVSAQTPLDNRFTFQGQIKQNGTPFNGSCDLTFKLFDAAINGNQIGSDQAASNVTVGNGLFSASLDFGAVFTGSKRWLEIQARCPAGSGTFAMLSPRQELTVSPNAAYALKAGSATTSASMPWSGLTGVPDGFADGVDNDTLYSAGTGLSLIGTQFNVNTGTIQQRVSVTCATGSSIRVINADGTVTCQADTNSGGTVAGVTATPPLASSGGTTPSISFTGILPIANGGTGASTQNYVDLTTGQSVGGTKTFTNAPSFAAAGSPFSVTNGGLVTNLNADQLDGQHATVFQQHYQNIKVVAKSGGDYATITAALNSITDASATNPYLVYVAPGVYSERVTMKAYVYIEGSGELTTKITYTGSASADTGTVVGGAAPAELRFLKVENTGGNTYAIAVYTNGRVRSNFTHITALASGGDNNYGVYNYGSEAIMTDVTAYASGGNNSYGVYNYGSYLQMTNVLAEAAFGISNNYGVLNENSGGWIRNSRIGSISALGGSSFGIYNFTYVQSMNYYVTIDQSQIGGGTNAIWNGQNYTILIGLSQINGTVAGVGAKICAGVYDSNYVFYASTCP